LPSRQRRRTRLHLIQDYGLKPVRKVILIQPPFSQLNSPYPALYYLKSFLERRGYPVTVLDHSIGLFERVFCSHGLRRIFSDASQAPLSRRGFNKNTSYYIERFFSESELWLASIDRLVAFLRGRDPEWGHFLALANGCVPGGPRTDAYLAGRSGDAAQVPDEARLIATKLLSDLADFITVTLDESLSLIRYSPVLEASLNSGLRDFSAVRKNLDGYIMNNFYRPMLAEEWEKAGAAPALLGVTIPFPGCLSGALVCAESAKKHFGSATRIVAGGGYVNTELRFLNAPAFFDYFDYLSFDRGYGSLDAILKHLEGEEIEKPPTGGIYKTMYRSQGRMISALDANKTPDWEAITSMEDIASSIEDTLTRTVFPDYSSVDYSRYLYPVDDANPMHRLWSDGHWLKAFLTHGCYWHSCVFCDVTLDYIRNFIPVDPAALFAHLVSQAEKTCVRGVHLCDEAAPPSSLLEFALLNREAGLPLCFWGNIRFEKAFDPDTVAALASGGLIGVSAGLEVASEKGLKRLGKGIDLESAVSALASFKEAGILTHAYLIYGYWDEDEQELIDSAETVRQLFNHRLLDSCFWHKFVLTRHSRVYVEKQRGLHPGLHITDDTCLNDSCPKDSVFALNDLSFEGEARYNKYTEGLESLLVAWIAGETERPVEEAFTFKVKSPSIGPDLIANLLNKYARDRDRRRSAVELAAGRVLFLGSTPRLRQTAKSFSLQWRWRLDDRTLTVTEDAEAEALTTLLETASHGKGMALAEFFSSLVNIAGEKDARRIWKRLREGGLVVVTN